jgi:hypothetical protein
VGYDSWKVLHVFGVLLLFLALGSSLALELAPAAVGARKLARALHGLALFLILVAGIALMSALGIHGRPPGWIMVKTAAWLLLGGAPVLIRRAPGLRTVLMIVLPLLGAVAAWAAISKP